MGEPLLGKGCATDSQEKYYAEKTVSQNRGEKLDLGSIDLKSFVWTRQWKLAASSLEAKRDSRVGKIDDFHHSTFPVELYHTIKPLKKDK